MTRPGLLAALEWSSQPQGGSLILAHDVYFVKRVSGNWKTVRVFDSWVETAD